MSTPPNGHGPEHSDRLMLYVLKSLSAGEKSALEAHFAECSECRGQIDSLRPVVGSVVDAPRATSSTAPSWERLARRIAEETGDAPPIALEDEVTWKEPEWQEAAPGLRYQLLSHDNETHRVTMLVRLERGV